MPVRIELLKKDTVFRFPQGRKYYVPIYHTKQSFYDGHGYNKIVDFVAYKQKYSNNYEVYYAPFGTLVNPY